MAKKLTRANFDAIRDHLFDRIHKNGEQLKNDFPNILRRAIEAEIWTQYADAEGKPFDNIVDWLHYTFPNGASMGQGQHALTYEEAIKLTEGSGDVHKVLLESTPRRKHGGDRKSAKGRGDQEASTPLAPVIPYRSGARALTLALKLSQDKPKVFADFQKGKYKSITEAAVAAGIRKNDGNLRRAKSAFRHLTDEERDEFLKWMKTPDATDGPAKK
ncbi:MAG TPA: hypothetical protein VFE62_14550 [Gemmataceae bacterium]|nr:hypothetical protein [Gemmataceae bacterium]